MAHLQTTRIKGNAKRPRASYKKDRNKITQLGRASRKTQQRLKIKERWAKNEAYQKKQTERLATLQSKPGYYANIELGKREHEAAKGRKRKL